MGLDGEVVSKTRTLWGHHDFIELQDGKLAWLGYDFRELEILEPLDGQPKNPDKPDGATWEVLGERVVADTIVIGDEGASDVGGEQELFNFFDDVSTDIYDVRYKPNTDIGFLGDDVYEYSHANSLVYHEDDDAFFIMYRWLDALQKIDHTSGEILWQFGDIPGVPGDVTGNDADRFVHAHFSETWEDKLLIFDNHDNANDPADPPSMLKEYTVDTVDETSKTFTLDWQYDSDRLETILGDVRRMPIEGCDNVLVSWSSQLRITEITRDGQVVWDLSGDIGNAVSRVQFIPDLHDFSDVAYPR